MQLRTRQIKAVSDLTDAYASGKNSPILVASTGFGKTHSAVEIIRRSLAKNKRVWFLCHLKELLDETSRKLAAFGIDHGWIAAGMPKSSTASVHLCMVQTVARHLNQCDRPDLIIVDEAHLAVADTYQTVFQWAAAGPQFYRKGGAYLLHLTATPQRLDGRGMGEVADIIVPTCSPAELISEGLLVPIRYFNPAAKNESGKRQMVGSPLEHYRAIAHGTKAIGFFASNRVAERESRRFVEAGIRSVAISGQSLPAERIDALDGIRSGRYDAVFNCKVWVAGVDAPIVSTIIDCNPSESLTYFLQSRGRGCRPYPGKEYMVCLDTVDNLSIHGDPTAERIWTLDGSDKGSGRVKDPEQFSVKTCPKCFSVNRSRNNCCTQCGTTFAPKPRDVKAVAGELKEVKEFQRIEARKEQGRATTLQDLIKLGTERGYKNPVFWAKRVMEGRR